jgi:sulfate transport system substrate-binding protein
MKRRISQTVYAKYASQSPKLNLFKVKDVYGDWNKIQVTHLPDGALFDQIYRK